MNSKLKIALITTGIVIPTYFGIRYFVRKSEYKKAEERYKEDDTEKKLIIMQLLIKKGLQPTTNNINSFMSYSIEDLRNLINTNLNFSYSYDIYGYESGDYDPYGYEYGDYDVYGYE